MSVFVRYLYWSDWGDNPHIGRIGMDGNNRSVIIQDKITWPNGLTLDFINDRIYWADAREDYIEFASLDGSNRHTGEEQNTNISYSVKRSGFRAGIILFFFQYGSRTDYKL